LATAHVRPFASETENALDATAALFLAVLGATSGVDATALGWTGSVVVSSITAIPVVLIAAFLLRQTWRKFEEKEEVGRERSDECSKYTMSKSTRDVDGDL